MKFRPHKTGGGNFKYLMYRTIWTLLCCLEIDLICWEYIGKTSNFAAEN